jgi:DNA-binding CsgD family transcriptional regulator
MVGHSRKPTTPPPKSRVDPYDVAIEAIYQCAHTPGHWPMALQAIADCFGDVGTTLTFRTEAGNFSAIVSPRLEPMVKAYNEYWCHHDIRGRHWDTYIYPDAITDRHLITQEEIDTHPFYTEFLVPNGLGWTAGLSISPVPYRVVLTLQRAKAKGPYTDEELAVLTRLGRHAERSLRLGIRLLDAELANLTFAEALTRLNIGVFLLDARGCVQFKNPIGERLLGDGLTIVNERLAIESREERTRFEAALAALAESGQAFAEDRPILVQRRSSSLRPLAVYLLPVQIAPERIAERLLANARVMLLVIDTQAGEAADPGLVRDLLGVTLGEARVAALVGAGQPPREAAKTLGISEETARTALKRVFAKTGVSRQSELAALLTRMVLR